MAKVKDSVKDPLEAASETPKVAELAQDEVEITHPDQLVEIQDKNKLAGFSGWFFLKGKDDDGFAIRVPSVNDKGEYVFVKGAKAVCKIIPAILLAIGLFAGSVFAASTTDEAVLGNDRWSVQNDGDLVPNANTYDIGSATQYPASIWVNGAEYTSFAAGTDGNWTDQGLTVTLDRAPTVFVNTISSGDVAATQFTPSGLTASRAVVSGASKTLASATTTTTELNYLAGVTSPTGTGALVLATTPTLVTPVIGDATGTSLALTGALSASTTVTATTGIVSSSTITLQNSETIVNSTNNIVEIGGGTGTTLSVLDTGTSDSDATLLLRADASADNGDDWQLVSDGATNSLLFQNDTSGSMATKFTIPTSGSITFADDIILENGEFIENDTTDDTVSVNSDDAALIFQVAGYDAMGGALVVASDRGDDAADKFKFSMDAADLMTITTGATTAATVSTAGLWTFPVGVTSSLATDASSLTAGSIITAGGLAVAKQLYVGDDIDMSVSGTGVYDITLKTNVADALSITDGTDIMVFNTTTGTPTVTITPNTTITGTLAQTGVATFSADPIIQGTTPLLTIGDGGDEDTGIQLNSDTSDYYIASENTLDALQIGLGSAIGTTPIWTMTSTTSTATSDLKFNTNLFANGRFGASSTIASSSNGINPSTIPYSILTKSIGNVAGETGTLPNGTAGQVLTILVDVCGTSGTWIVTPTSTVIGTITFNAAGDRVTLLYDATVGWIPVGYESVTFTYKGKG